MKNQRPLIERAIVLVLAAGLLLTATIVTQGNDHFRLPKEVVFRGEAIVLLALAAFWATSKRKTWTIERGPEIVVTLAIVAWTLIATATSTNRLLSIDSFVTIAAAAVIFLATVVAAQSLSWIAIDVVMIGCGINALIVILQEAKIWQPLPAYPGITTHYASVGLLGNANDVGMFLAAPAAAALVVAVICTGTRRWIYAAIGMLLVGGIAASATRTAIAALMAGLVVFALRHSRRAAILVLVVALVFGVVIASPSTFVGKSMRTFAHAAAHGDMEVLFSERLVPFLAAVDMTRDHPLLGVGPGCFRYHFMRYRVALFGRYPARWTQGYPMNWGAAHNDHLEILAETGVPGYALFVAAVVVFVRRRRTSPATPLATFARAFRWPFAAVVVTIFLAQFPLELAAPRLVLLTLAALCAGWDA